jgi:sucrose-6-phosphate hydrolase SacC (GH32 family)
MKKLGFVLALAVIILTGCGARQDGNDVIPAPEPTTAPTATIAPTSTPTPTPLPEYNNYLFVYFVGEGVGEESIYFAVSEDGFHWKEVNGGEPVLTSNMGTTGLRDPFIMRSADNSTYYLIATDLCINKNGDWWHAQSAGSRSIMVWESSDLINWSEQRMVNSGLKTAGCVWAPEAFYNEETGEYMVFWASRTSGDGFGKQRMFYATTMDFKEFSEPKVWMDYDHDVIDASVIKEGDKYYRFVKYEGEARIILESADSLLGEWTSVKSMSLLRQAGVEGPTCFKLHEEDAKEGQNYILLLDNYGKNGYYYLTAETVASGKFDGINRKEYTMPGKKARHGTVIAISEEEYQNIVEKYGIEP